MILANLFAQDFIWAWPSFCCWDVKIIYNDTFTTSKPPSQSSEMIENDFNESLFSPSWVWSPWCVCQLRPGDRRVRTWGDALPKLDWTQTAASDRSAIKSDFSLSYQPILISCVEPIGRDMQLGVITKILTISWCPHKWGVAWLFQYKNTEWQWKPDRDSSNGWNWNSTTRIISCQWASGCLLLHLFVESEHNM